ncbi:MULTISPECIES: FecR domain-containing protein [unclassified Carboxylicivirga]|uniref:FecR domain-containing protein n=1 Tax=Carboxylicivirga TaxID=1628153 RepID=UPI003D35620D
MLKQSFFIAFINVCLMAVCLSCSAPSVRTGDKAQLVKLSDGSQVVLNQHSVLQYEINDEHRDVTLQGDAFFKVNKTGIPFKVHTAHGSVTVLGTSFAVATTEESLAVEVDEGEVEVETVQGSKRVKRRERVFYSDVKKLFKKGHAEFKHHIWTDEFKDDMRALGKEIERGGKKVGKELKRLGRDLNIKM